jgi:hypothetical protein
MRRQDAMEIFRNEASKDWFIFINNTEPGKGIFVTPCGQIKELEFRLFCESIEQHKFAAVARKQVSRVQIVRYEEYRQNRKHDALKREQRRAEEMAVRQLERALAKLPLDQLRMIQELLEIQI